MNGLFYNNISSVDKLSLSQLDCIRETWNDDVISFFENRIFPVQMNAEQVIPMTIGTNVGV